MAIPPPNTNLDFHLVAEREGWLLINQHLYWTTTAGDAWQDITPAIAPAAIQAVFFLDTRRGWVLSSRATGANSPTYALARTADGGKSWQNQTLALFTAGTAQPPTNDASLFFVDAETGWLVLRQATNSNFVLGMLFRTSDGGKSWTPLSIPIGEPVYFIDRDVGWTAGGPDGDQLFKSEDGGRSWQPQAPFDSSAQSQKRYYQLPRFKDEREGVLFALAPEGTKTQVEAYRSHDGGASWSLEMRAQVDQAVSDASDLPTGISSPDDWLLLAPQRQTMVSRARGAAATMTQSRDNKTAGIHRLDMGSGQAGWGWYSAGDCTFVRGSPSLPKTQLNCTRENALLRTQDGGKTWQTLALPQAAGDQVGRAALGASQYMQAQGFDKCEVADLSELQTWWLSSPYDAVNLYIGGANRHCANTPLSAWYLGQMRNQGWRFIPTWVGPQAPCTANAYPYKFDYNTTTAYNQGASEADQAANAAANLGLGTGGVVYLDIEWYDATNVPCKNAVNAFVSGWSGRLRARGYSAGAYGATCSGMSDWAGIANVPDAIWGARWSDSYYNPGASVWGLPCVADYLWSNHQRIHQYTGGHNETWGGVTLNIDSDVIDGLVADLGSTPPSPPAVPSNPNPPDNVLLPRTSRLTLYWNTNGTTCDLHIWGGDVGDRVYTGLGCGSAFFGAHYAGSYQWQITARNSYYATPGPTWHFQIQPYGPTNLRAARLSASQISLSWTRSLDDPGYIDNYRVYRNGALLTTLPPGSSTLTVSDSGCATNYAFHITAVRQGIESFASNRIWNCTYFPLVIR